MGKSVAVYYSSSAESGNTARLLASFMRGIERGGDTTETFAVKDLKEPLGSDLRKRRQKPEVCSW
ncbi:hypothetical protein KAX17_14615 [Candidatus Bipolaricaulota bacterium]|nr:hypothetical protein [Candidatus Bipolaricaulota bacterium]